MEAYNLLSSEKQENESFSKVIKRTMKKKRKTADSLLLNLDKMVLEKETLDKVDAIVKARQENIISSPVLDEDD